MAARLLIVGASARAAAWSARRAGFEVVAVDLFGDRDLRLSVAGCCVVAAGDYPRGLVDAARSLDCDAWMYTGGLENRPDVVDALGSVRPLFGNPGAVLRAVRDPERVAAVLREAGFPHLRVQVGTASGLARDGSWLAKPLASAGGEDIEVLTPETELRAGRYYQEYLAAAHRAGLTQSALFVSGRGGTRLAGVADVLTGTAGPFSYGGNLTSRPLEGPLMQNLKLLGSILATAFGLRGLFGVDFIPAGAWPMLLEVNPRYTGAVEVHELAQRRSLIPEHVRAFGGRPPANPRERGPARFVGKVIRYARIAMTVNIAIRTPIFSEAEPYCVPRIGDVPASESAFREGEPICTFFEEGPSYEDVRTRLAGLM